MLLKFPGEQINSKQECSQVCSYNRYFFIINNGTFLRLNLMKITHQNDKTHQSFQNFLGEHAHEPPSISAAVIIYESIAIFYSEFLQNINQNASIVASFQKFYREL